MKPKDRIIQATDAIAVALQGVARINLDNPKQSSRVMKETAALLDAAAEALRLGSEGL